MLGSSQLCATFFLALGNDSAIGYPDLPKVDGDVIPVTYRSLIAARIRLSNQDSI